VTTPTRILASQIHGALWLRVEGKGSFSVSPQLSRFTRRRIDEGQHHVVVDLEECPTMDSTFMGTLTGLAVRLMEMPAGRLQVVNPNPRNTELLRNLGLDNIFDVDAEGRAWQEERQMISRCRQADVCAEGGSVQKRDQTECMLEAHQNLAGACDTNVPKFRDVIECLEKELAAQPA
jgi:anti-anti-sigma factor